MSTPGTPVLIDAARTPYGRRGGELSHLHAAQLLGLAQRGILERTGVDAADVAGETLAVDFAARVAGRDIEVPGDPADTAWQAEVFGSMPDHVGYVPAGTYANEGGFHVAVSRVGA